MAHEDTHAGGGGEEVVQPLWREEVAPGTTGAALDSFSRRAFWHALQALIPEVKFGDLVPAGAGVRAQAVEPSGKLVDDFFIRQADRMVHVLNAPSPAATASISIGRTIADMALRDLGLPPLAPVEGGTATHFFPDARDCA